MDKQRKIALVVNKGSFTEVEERDNIFWSLKSEIERFRELISLRNTFFSNEKKIEKVVFKRNIYEKETN